MDNLQFLKREYNTLDLESYKPNLEYCFWKGMVNLNVSFVYGSSWTESYGYGASSCTIWLMVDKIKHSFIGNHSLMINMKPDLDVGYDFMLKNNSKSENLEAHFVAGTMYPKELDFMHYSELLPESSLDFKVYATPERIFFKKTTIKNYESIAAVRFCLRNGKVQPRMSAGIQGLIYPNITAKLLKDISQKL